MRRRPSREDFDRISEELLGTGQVTGRERFIPGFDEESRLRRRIGPGDCRGNVALNYIQPDLGELYVVDPDVERVQAARVEHDVVHAGYKVDRVEVPLGHRGSTR